MDGSDLLDHFSQPPPESGRYWVARIHRTQVAGHHYRYMLRAEWMFV